METTDVDLELASLRRLTSMARSAASRCSWRAAMQARALRVRDVVRAVALAVHASGTYRRKTLAGWHVCSASAVIVTVVTACPARTLRQLAMPLDVHVHRSAELDVEALRSLERRGLVFLITNEMLQ